MEICDVELWNSPAAEGDASRQATLLSILTISGQRGWGEVRPGWPGEQLHDRARGLLAQLAGRPMHHVAEIASSQLGDDPAIACAVEIALWDAIAQSARQPLCNLWGGAFRTHIPLAIYVEAEDLPAGRQHVRELHERGSRHFVLACTGSVERDVEAVRQLQQLTGPNCQLAADGRARYFSDHALRFCDMLPRDALTELIDPIAGGDLAATCSLARRCSVPLAVSRSIGSDRDVTALLRDQGIRGVYIDPCSVGGLLAARRCLTVAAAGGLAASFNMVNTGGITVAGMLHLAASMPSLDHPHLFRPFSSSQVQSVQGLCFADGAAVVPPGNGLGITVTI